MGGGSLFQVGHNVELTRVLVQLSIVVVFIVLFERVLHRLEHKLERYPKYHEMMTKVFGELMILGFIGLCIKILKELAHLDAYSPTMIAFQAADLTVFIIAIALILQSICVFLRLRSQNMLWDKAELIGSEELLGTIRAHTAEREAAKSGKASSSARSARNTLRESVRGQLDPHRSQIRPGDFYELVEMRIIRHLFLRRVQLPELFPFAKYLRQAQENQITHMIEVEVSTWIILLALGWALHTVAMLIQTKKGVSESESIIPAFLIFSWVSVILHFGIRQYLAWALRQVLFRASNFTGRANWLVCLAEVAMHEVKSVDTEVASQAIETMEAVRDRERGRKGKRTRNALTSHDVGFQLVSTVARNVHKRVSTLRASRGSSPSSAAGAAVDREVDTVEGGGDAGDASVDPHGPLQIKWFSRKAWHFIVVSTFMANAFYVALFTQCIIHQLDDVVDDAGVWMVFLLVLPSIINVFVLHPQIMWHFTLVSSVVRVDIAALGDVIDHFTDTIQLRSELVEMVWAHLEATDQGLGAVQEALAANDPDRTGLLEVDDLRDVLADFGVHLSFFRFNSVARLLFDFKGTKVPYEQLIRLLELGSAAGAGADASVDHTLRAKLSPMALRPVGAQGAPGDAGGAAVATSPTQRQLVSQSQRLGSLAQRPSLLHMTSQRLGRSMYRLDVTTQQAISEEPEGEGPPQRGPNGNGDASTTAAATSTHEFQRLSCALYLILAALRTYPARNFELYLYITSSHNREVFISSSSSCAGNATRQKYFTAGICQNHFFTSPL